MLLKNKIKKKKKCESLIFRRTNSKHNQAEEEKINFSVDGTRALQHLQIAGGAHRRTTEFQQTCSFNMQD